MLRHLFLISIFIVLLLSSEIIAQNKIWKLGRESTSIDPAVQPDYNEYDWPDNPPEDCPYEQSNEIKRIHFTGRYANYTGADTWYPMWASDGNQYSTWTDGFIWTNRSVPWIDCQYTNPGRKMEPIDKWTADYPQYPQLYHSHSNVPPTCVGIAKIVGDSPLNLDVINLGKLYSGNNLYPCVCLIADNNFFIGTYDAYSIGGRFNGFRYSNNWDHWVEETEAGWENQYWKDVRSEETDFFAADSNPRRFNVPHAVVFGQNNNLSPDGKVYFTSHGEIKGGKSNWDKGDAIYLCRTNSDPNSVINTENYEFFNGHNSNGEAIWVNDVTKSKPILEWKDHLGSEGITFIPALRKYILMTARLKENENNLPYNVLIFWESDNITGPYKMVHYLKDWGPQTYFPNIPAKFISPDGKTMWLCVASNYSNSESNPVQCRYGFSLHEISLETNEYKWEKPSIKSINIAPKAVVSTSAQESNPEAVNDGKRDLESQQWISKEGTGSWIRLEWNENQMINKIRLWDLPEIDSWILNGTFSFSDGSTEKLNAWTSNRAYAPSEISFKSKSVTWVKFTIDQAYGSVLGLSELEVYTDE
ncbi:MAG: hypothetical protein KDC88_02400 [Ignavibacteriae bacterium]|nr:hypothetical protein [Ignavibacteriota bacterium]MCB9208985.1 hypothetical protein [Ignavibacteriales bacterium]MCB9218094.1 hypothetical protein [Ignavibacteriales bacterium]MCB9260483.1 hypothetical protein [Ignavibacteriales bacterium]